MYIAKIPGTRYVTSLESKSGQWYLRLKLGETVEAEVELEQISSREVHARLGDLFKQVSLQINDIQQDLIHKELIAQIQHLLMQDHSNIERLPKKNGDSAPRHDPRVDQLFEKLDRLENILATLSDRVERMEALSK